MKITILDAYPLIKDELNYSFLEKYAKVEVYNNTNSDEIISRLKDTDICITNKVIIDKEVIDNTNLKYILISATGTNNVDLAYAKEKNIPVSNCKNYSTDFVAQHTIAFILYHLNQIEAHKNTIENWVNNQYFSYTVAPLSELKNKTVGIIGYGNIAKKVIKILNAFDANVIVCNRTKYDDGTKFVELEELLNSSDIISLHCPLTVDNTHMINKESLKNAKDGVLVINTARGGLVNSSDMIELVNSKKIAHYYTDVLEIEPPTSSEFITTNNITANPHVAWSSIEARKRLLSIIDESVEKYLQNDFSNML